ncbi:MAG: heme-binding protein [Myxococcota bacterium]
MKTVQLSSISLESAITMAAEAQAKAAELGLCIAVTIVDHSGVQKLFSRMDGAPLVANDASYRKARTAVGFGLPTGKAWHDFIKDDPILSGGASSLQDFTLLGGGIPIHADGQIVGAIGVAGGHYSHDEQCAKAALDVLDLAA